MVFLDPLISLPSVCPSLAKRPQVIPTISRSMQENTVDKLTKYFFTEFIVKNDFAGGALDLEAVIHAFQTSSSLFHASVAVAALDRSKNHLLTLAERRTASMTALSSYQSSISNIRVEIQGTKLINNDAPLWTTFFLGIFEVVSLNLETIF